MRQDLIKERAAISLAWWQMPADMAQKLSLVRPGVNIQSMVNVIQNADVWPAIVKSMMSATTEHLTWRPYLTFCPKGCVLTIAIVPCVRSTFCCPQNRLSHLIPCRPRRQQRVT